MRSLVQWVQNSPPELDCWNTKQTSWDECTFLLGSNATWHSVTLVNNWDSRGNEYFPFITCAPHIVYCVKRVCLPSVCLSVCLSVCVSVRIKTETPHRSVTDADLPKVRTLRWTPETITLWWHLTFMLMTHLPETRAWNPARETRAGTRAGFQRELQQNLR